MPGWVTLIMLGAAAITLCVAIYYSHQASRLIDQARARLAELDDD